MNMNQLQRLPTVTIKQAEAIYKKDGFIKKLLKTLKEQNHASKNKKTNTSIAIRTSKSN